MKRMKKLASLILAVVMVLSMTVSAFAEETEYTITVQPQNNTNVTLKGNTYFAYKLFDVTYDTDRNAYAYTIAESFKDFEYIVEEKDETGEIVNTTIYSEKKDDETGHIIDGHSSLIAYIESFKEHDGHEELNKIAEEALIYAKSNKVYCVAAKAESESVVIDVKEPGYYLVAGSATAADNDNQTIIAACSLSTVAPNTTVNVKADAPKLEKKIIEEGKPVDANNAAIGDTVHYQITSKVPNMTGYEKYYFIVNDTLSAGLDFTLVDKTTNENPVLNPEITVGGEKLTYSDNYTVETEDNTNGTTSIAIIFKDFINYKEQAGADIVINYTAVINENAVIGDKGNDNVAKLQYSNNPNVTPEGADKPGPNDGKVTGETPEDRVITYVTGVEIIKVDGANNDRLKGAEFTINGEKINKIKVIRDVFEESEDGTYYKLKDGTYTTAAPTEDTLDSYEDEETTYEKVSKPVAVDKVENVGVRGTVDDNGILHFDGLAAGDYTITEVVAPNGYNLLEDPIRLRVTCVVPDTVDDDHDTAEWGYMANGAGMIDARGSLNGDGRIELTVANNAGTMLPSTGGIGTTIFYAAGIILMAGAVFFVVRRKKA